MIRAFLVLAAPAETWERIAAENHGPGRLALLYLLPLLLVTSAAESFALTQWGEVRGAVGHVAVYPLAAVVPYGLAQVGLGLALVFLSALVIRWISDSFHFSPPYRACFALSAYGLSPIFLARFIDCVPSLNTWIAWVLGVVGCALALYQGTGLVLKPDQTKGFGLYFLGVVVGGVLSGVAHLVARMVLEKAL